MQPFKVCTLCGQAWGARGHFLADPKIRLAGYMANFKALELGLLLFNHDACGTTLAVEAGDFADLVDGPVFASRLTGQPECPGYCLRQEELRPCPARCECAHVRQVLDRVARWEKTPQER